MWPGSRVYGGFGGGYSEESLSRGAVLLPKDKEPASC